jgi:Uma2 family endonuclease
MIHPPRTGLQAFEMLPEGTRCQLINDTIVMSPAPLMDHNDVSRSIFRAIDRKVLLNNLGETYYAPIDVYLNNKNVYQPDILFIAAERKHIIDKKGIIGAPDLIIEILSGGNAHYDRGVKKQVYEQTGVKEYWMINPTSKRCEGYILKDGKFEAIEPTNGSFHIQLIDLIFKF